MLIRSKTKVRHIVDMDFIYDDPECNKSVSFTVGDIVKVAFNCPKEHRNIRCVGRIIGLDLGRLNPHRTTIEYPFSSRSDEVGIIIDASDEYKSIKYNIMAKDIIDICIYDDDAAATIVRNQFELDDALSDPNVEVINIKTSTEKVFNIPAENYSSKILTVDAPLSDINNKGVFKYIQINGKTEKIVMGFVEQAVGNSFIFKESPAGSLTIHPDAYVKRIYANCTNLYIKNLGHIQLVEIDEDVNQVMGLFNHGFRILVIRDSKLKVVNNSDEVIYVEYASEVLPDDTVIPKTTKDFDPEPQPDPDPEPTPDPDPDNNQNQNSEENNTNNNSGESGNENTNQETVNTNTENGEETSSTEQNNNPDISSTDNDSNNTSTNTDTVDGSNNNENVNNNSESTSTDSTNTDNPNQQNNSESTSTDSTNTDNPNQQNSNESTSTDSTNTDNPNNGD